MHVNVIGPYYLRKQATVSSHKVILLKPTDSLRKLSESLEWTKVQTYGLNVHVGFIPNSVARLHYPPSTEIGVNHSIHYSEAAAGEITAAPAVSMEKPLGHPSLPQSILAPPWMNIAQNEFRKKVIETGNPPNPEILKYFLSTSWKYPKFEAPWCAAFVSFCMENCGNEFVKLNNLGSARASAWAKWGTRLNMPKYGALAVLRPSSRGMSGHVGFVSGFSEKYVELLGGNQNNALTKRKFSLDKVLQIRWLNWLSSPYEPESVYSTSSTGKSDSVFNAKYSVEFRSLVPNGYFSFDPDDMSVRRSIRTNNPGALNISNWQKSFAGFVGTTPGDREGNKTSIYVTPEHGVAAWFKLITEIYRFSYSTRFQLSELAIRYSGSSKASDKRVRAYLKGWDHWSGGYLKKSHLIDLDNPIDLLMLAKGMFSYEAGLTSPLLDTQISDGIKLYVTGHLPLK